MIIDFHTHVFPPQIKRNRGKYIEADPCFALLYSQKDARLATADELVTSMDKEGVDISVITNIGWITHELCIETNDYILESIARYPKRLIGFGAVQPGSYQAALDEIERCASGGIKGIGELRPDVQLLDITDRQLISPFMESLKKHKLTLLVHASEPVGHHYPGKGSITPRLLYSLITDFPEVPIVLKNVYFDTAASPFLYSPEVYRQVSQLVGDDKVLFGSDWPLLSPGRLLKEINSLNLPEATRDLILAGNARKLLGIVDKQA
jgi:predicted TIM-barrel fold metal-dependent hydrolase